MSWFTKILLISSLILSSGCLYKIDQEHEIETINIVVHARSKHDVKVLLPMLLRYSSPILADAKIDIKVVEIVYDTPILEATIEDISKFIAFDDGRVHVFFIHEYDKLYPVNIAGVQFSSGICKQAIVITDKTSRTTLAHEIGHFFGLNHKEEATNIMHYGIGRDASPVFNRYQTNRMHSIIDRRKMMCKF